MQLKKRYLVLIILGFIGWFGFETLTPHHRLLAQEVFYSSPDIELMLILRHDNYPLHFVGNAYTVACKSKTTANMPAYDSYKVPAGWNVVPGFLGSAYGGDTDQIMTDLLAKAKATYLVTEGLLLVPDGTNLWVSTDSCYSFKNWSLLDNLPTQVVVKNLPAYDSCEEGRLRDIASGINRPNYSCQDLNFIEEGIPTYGNIVFDKNGTLSFTVKAKALGGQKLVVTSDDQGKTWTTNVVGVVSGSVTDTDGQLVVAMQIAEPRRVVIMEVRTKEGGILALYDMGENGDQVRGDAVFSSSVPTWLTTEELAEATVVVGYSDGYMIQQPLFEYLQV